MNLREACMAMKDEIRGEYELGEGDAADLFEAVWATMIRDVQGVEINNAINKVSDDLGIG